MNFVLGVEDLIWQPLVELAFFGSSARSLAVSSCSWSLRFSLASLSMLSQPSSQIQHCLLFFGVGVGVMSHSASCLTIALPIAS